MHHIPGKLASGPYVRTIVGQRCPKLDCTRVSGHEEGNGENYRTICIWHYGAKVLSVTVQYHYIILAF